MYELWDWQPGSTSLLCHIPIIWEYVLFLGSLSLIFMTLLYWCPFSLFASSISGRFAGSSNSVSPLNVCVPSVSIWSSFFPLFTFQKKKNCWFLSNYRVMGSRDGSIFLHALHSLFPFDYILHNHSAVSKPGKWHSYNICA